MVQLDMPKLSPVHLRGMDSRSYRRLVGDREERLYLVAAGDLEVVLELLGLQIVTAGLNLHQSCPDAGPPADPDQPVGDHLLPVQVELDLDECLDLSRRCAYGLRQ